MNAAPTALVMAAGQGTRMRSDVPKVLHEVCGRPMVAWPILAAKEAGAGRVCVIVSPDRDLSPALPNGTETVVQPEADGTGGALRAALDVITDSDTVLVLSGDHPLVSAEILDLLIATHRDAGAAATLMTTELDDPGSYGRIVRNGKGEYYLGDVLPLMRDAGGSIAAYQSPDPGVNLGVNDRVDLARASEEARRRLLEEHMRNGVTILDPQSTWIDAGVEIAPDVVIAPGTSLRGTTSVGSGSQLGPMTTLIDAKLGERVTVPHSYLTQCEVADDAQVGPFAYLRPDAQLGPGSKAGAFVEIKNSQIGEGAKVPHLSYVGDAEIGAGANLGAGTITANYDGFRKHKTKVGKNVKTGVDTALVAPVEVGDEAYTGAGSVITEDVPEGALGITRAEQQSVEGYAEKKAKEAESEGKGS